MAEYLVVSRAESGVRFGKTDPLRLTGFPSPFGPVDAVIQTRLAPFPGVSRPVPRGLMAEVRGVAPSLEDALQQFSGMIQSICPVLAFIGNSPIEDMIPVLGFESSPGVTERDFFQLFLPEDPLLVVERRRLPSALASRVLETLLKHKEVERLRRSLGQYYQALQNWQPGYEVLALAHLWMGMEAITPVVLRRHLADLGVSRSSLADTWKVEERNLDAEVRRRLIMRGNAQAYASAKRASDGFEHGFLGFDEIRTESEKAREDSADGLRQSICEELQLKPEDFNALMAPPYQKPGHLRVTKSMRGKLVSNQDDLAAPDQAYPLLEWETNYREVPNPDSEDIKLAVEETFTPRLAEGVQFRPQRIEVRTGQESTLSQTEN